MPYVQSCTTLRLHPKTARLRTALGELLGERPPRYAVVGWLHLLWHWTLDYSPYGDLSRYSVAEPAGYAGLRAYAASSQKEVAPQPHPSFAGPPTLNSGR